MLRRRSFGAERSPARRCILTFLEGELTFLLSFGSSLARSVVLSICVLVVVVGAISVCSSCCVAAITEQLVDSCRCCGLHRNIASVRCDVIGIVASS